MPDISEKPVSLRSKGEINERLIRSLIYHQGPLSRIEIGDITQMSPAALTAICGGTLLNEVRSPASSPRVSNRRLCQTVHPTAYIH